jgi:hypothetical protein
MAALTQRVLIRFDVDIVDKTAAFVAKNGMPFPTATATVAQQIQSCSALVSAYVS